MFENAAAQPARTAALAIATLAAATLAGAWMFQFGFGIQPCPLCLEQRYAYYIAVPLAWLLVAGASFGASRKVLVAGFVVIAGFMLWNAVLGAYHAGVEWKWWAGPQDCAGPITDLGGAGGLLKKIETIRIVRCDEVQWRFLGLSLAGYNVLISLALAVVALWGAFGAYRTIRESD
jgi:disulfide bond formation protein DsbB